MKWNDIGYITYFWSNTARLLGLTAFLNFRKVREFNKAHRVATLMTASHLFESDCVTVCSRLTVTFSIHRCLHQSLVTSYETLLHHTVLCWYFLKIYTSKLKTLKASWKNSWKLLGSALSGVFIDFDKDVRLTWCSVNIASTVTLA